MVGHDNYVALNIWISYGC